MAEPKNQKINSNWKAQKGHCLKNANLEEAEDSNALTSTSSYAPKGQAGHIKRATYPSCDASLNGSGRRGPNEALAFQHSIKIKANKGSVSKIFCVMIDLLQ
eukprot:gnl/MRDRNA2_/MRDRNA2_16265_c0_seq1.p1 gnl/MRDRNA2_/MRDRNA2_16265_c0~~gnl/MRDRNA2_/MRDRNA2_16265_c0_seq1.p1  ORF type:complete len:102 (-),score=13.84 gnl/MRDRNA2_/MRDRNA2_16265_c0_seq1:213-518(-)